QGSAPGQKASPFDGMDHCSQLIQRFPDRSPIGYLSDGLSTFRLVAQQVLLRKMVFEGPGPDANRSRRDAGRKP
ncbi:MAG: hypothetical protein ACK559_30150, partial [bacterium]